MKKRPFLLIELFVALALISIAIVPLLLPSTFYLKQRREKLLHLELERYAELQFIKARANLIQKQWEEVATKPIQERFPSVSIFIEELGIYNFYCGYQLKFYKGNPKQTDEAISCRKFRCEIFFSQDEKELFHKKKSCYYCFTLFARR